MFNKKTKEFRLILLGLLIALPVVGSLVGIKLIQFSAMGEAAAKQVMPPEPVNAADVREVLWQPKILSVGTVMAVQGTDVSTEVDGVVREIHQPAGSIVQAGDVLAQLDADVESTQLRVALATAELARSSFKRAKDLVGKNSISQAEFDEASSKLRQAEAQVDNIQALVHKKTVRAPFAGKLGIRRISVGEFLQKGSPIVSLQSLDPVYVDFSAPQQQLADLKEGLPVSVVTDSYPKQVFKGEITAINPDIDPNTRSIRVQATLVNPDGLLRPGMFVEIEWMLERTQQVLVIPETAVLHAPFGDSVFIIEGAKQDEATSNQNDPAGADRKLTVRQQFVRLGKRQGDFVAVTKGLTVGQQVVSTGTFKLRSGMPVVIDNSLAPDFKFAPNPDNT